MSTDTLTDTDALTEIVRDWARRSGTSVEAAEQLLVDRDAQTLRRAAAFFIADAKQFTLTNAEALGWTMAANRLRKLAQILTPTVRRIGLQPVTSLSARGSLYSPAELRVVRQIARGGDLAEVAERAGMSVHTLKTHLRRIKRKSGATSNAHIVALAIAQGQVPVDVALTDERGEPS